MRGSYLRDPQESELGKKIIKHGILAIDELGFEAFTFKKLAARMKSTEASMYRYFENKHKLLLYLVSWYWEWLSYSIDISTMNITSAKRRLEIIVETLVSVSQENPSIEYVNESVLHRIIIAEGSKTYHIKEVDQENNEGFFINYKNLVNKVAQVIKDYRPDFPYPRSLASNLFEMTNNQIYFSEHLPRLTDIQFGENRHAEVVQMLNHFLFSILGFQRMSDSRRRELREVSSKRYRWRGAARGRLRKVKRTGNSPFAVPHCNKCCTA